MYRVKWRSARSAHEQPAQALHHGAVAGAFWRNVFRSLSRFTVAQLLPDGTMDAASTVEVGPRRLAPLLEVLCTVELHAIKERPPVQFQRLRLLIRQEAAGAYGRVGAPPPRTGKPRAAPSPSASRHATSPVVGEAVRWYTLTV
ncbi:hypothetical protein DAETH_40050 (plasmid) [Deinococcus aetherius]|uniref:Uncharacterized protein n=1 Tax=Deinococcus aetherius TaxID=200252 RepID=A0ABN6RQJ1_9DEIO|nr:hypothetical protein DAETH_40050 [Deinococcus aetherius]